MERPRVDEILLSVFSYNTYFNFKNYEWKQYKMNAKTDFQIGMDESKTLQIDQKTGGPQAAF